MITWIKETWEEVPLERRELIQGMAALGMAVAAGISALLLLIAAAHTLPHFWALAWTLAGLVLIACLVGYVAKLRKQINQRKRAKAWK